MKTIPELPVLGCFYSPNGIDKWQLIAIDIRNRIFLETSEGKIYLYDKDAFNNSFSIWNESELSEITN